MLGQAISMVLPKVVGYKLTGHVNPFITSTDVVLTITKVETTLCVRYPYIIFSLEGIFFSKLTCVFVFLLFIHQHLRQTGVVGKFVEFFGPGVAQLSIADRATIANMCPEYGATVGFFPVDDKSLLYLRQTGKIFSF